MGQSKASNRNTLSDGSVHRGRLEDYKFFLRFVDSLESLTDKVRQANREKALKLASNHDANLSWSA